MRPARPLALIWLLSLCLLCMQGGLRLHALGHAVETLAHAAQLAQGGDAVQAEEHCALCDAAAVLSAGAVASAPGLAPVQAAHVLICPERPGVRRCPNAGPQARAPPAVV